jgi:hypothetical protein
LLESKVEQESLTENGVFFGLNPNSWTPIKVSSGLVHLVTGAAEELDATLLEDVVLEIMLDEDVIDEERLMEEELDAEEPEELETPSLEDTLDELLDDMKLDDMEATSLEDALEEALRNGGKEEKGLKLELDEWRGDSTITELLLSLLPEVDEDAPFKKAPLEEACFV